MIYIVDDDPIQRMLINQLISAGNTTLTVQSFENGQEALNAILAGDEPTIILLDLNMPIMNGWEFLLAYSKAKTKADVYIVTSSSDMTDVEQSKDFKFIKGYFTKPLDGINVSEVLKSL